MKQVFIKTVDAIEPANGTPGSARFSDLEAGKVGFWDVNAHTSGGNWFASALAATTVAEADTAGAVDGTSIATAIPLIKRFQVSQGYGSGNPIASPMITADKLVRVVHTAHETFSKHKWTFTPSTNVANGEEAELKFIIRSTPTHYGNYASPTNAIVDLSNEGKIFPLGGFNTTNHKAINISFVGGADATATCNALRTAIANSPILDALFVTSGTATCIIEARHAGVIFDVISYNLTDDAYINGATVLTSAWNPGCGNDYQVFDEEVQARAQAGNFNRMYFPQDFTTFSANGATYDRFEITYRIDGDRDVVKGSQFGTVVIYEVAGQDNVAAVLGVAGERLFA
jgi:hypothetical protein